VPKVLAGVLALSLLSSGGCQSFAAPPNAPRLVLHYPDGFVADLPHLNPGDRVPVAVLVTTSHGAAVAGVEIIWDDGFYPSHLQPYRLLSDAAGRVTVTWVLAPLPEGTFSERQSIRAYLPGADNSPIEYRALVIPCTRC
jgi:hypothetical protein